MPTTTTADGVRTSTWTADEMERFASVYAPAFDEALEAEGFDLKAAGLGRPLTIASGDEGAVVVTQPTA